MCGQFDTDTVTSMIYMKRYYSKICLKGPLKEDKKLFFKTNNGLMQVESIAECAHGAFCSNGSILQYFDLH